MQERNQQKASVLYNELESLTPFTDSFSIYLFKKTEKIVLALYLVTDHLSDVDAMRMSVRSMANEILKDGITVTSRYAKIASDEVMISHMYEVSALLEIAALTKLVAPNNTQIIKEEIARLAKDITSHQEAHLSGSNLKKSFFVVDTVSQIPTVAPASTHTHDVLYKGHKGQLEKDMSLKKPFVQKFATQEPKARKEIIQKDTPKKDERTEKIVGVIKEKGHVTIKDVAEAFSGIGEKTIQRELQKMVSLGVLKKDGERRWSTYSIL